jgi:hypothetical protein
MEKSMRWQILLAVSALLLASAACAGEEAVLTPFPTEEVAQDITASESSFGVDHTAYGFFPSPPDVTFESILKHFEALGEHADFILIQPNVPWMDFVDGIEGDSKSREDLRNQIVLAEMNGLEWAFVIDPLNGLNRREFFGLPAGWEASFANPEVRRAFENFTLWCAREFDPVYLGLASEINTYMDAYPEDVEHYLSLYQSVYARVKEEDPDTQVFVTFQWDDLNNMFKAAAEGRQPYDTNWEQVELFEPQLDVWAMSSYPYFVFNGQPIPDDYYSPLIDRTDKPLAISEGGFSSRSFGPIVSSPESQVAYLNAIEAQLGDRLVFWVYLILTDLNMDSLEDAMRQNGMSRQDIDTLSMFATIGLREFDGTPKPALEVWDRLRGEG